MDNLETLDESGKPPESRIKDANSAYQIWNTLRSADYTSALQRSRVDAMYDNEAPYIQSQLDATGQSFKTNVNWGYAESLLETAMSGYNDIESSVETLFECPTTVGDEATRYENEKILSKEITDTIRSWDDYHDVQGRLKMVLVKHGVGIKYFKDETDWRWDATDMSDFKIPRKTKIGQSNIGVACCLRFFSPGDLYNHIKDPEQAKDLGYDVEAIRKAIQNSVKTGNNFAAYSNYDWEKLEIELKNNDLFFSSGAADADNIRVVNMWVQEFDGRVSYYWILDDNKSESFLYKNIGRFDNVFQAYTVFTFGVGTNGYYHGVRGQGYKVFPQVNALNRLWCQAMDGTMLASTTMVQPESEDDLQNLQLTYYGPWTVLPSKLKVIERPAIPNVATQVLPAIQGMSQMVGDRSASYNTQQFINDNREKTKFEIQAQLGAIAKMSSSALNLYYAPEERHLREVVRRMIRPSYDAEQPGGMYVAQLKKRLLRIGGQQLLEAFYGLDVDRLKIVRAIGGGSEAARLLALNTLGGLAGSLDDLGRANLIYDTFSEYVGHQTARRYIQPPGSEARPTDDTKIAELQNDALLSGGQASVWPNDNHFAHATVHLSALMPMVEQAQQNPDSLGQVLNGVAALTEHTYGHVERLSQDPNMRQQAAAMRQALQAATEIVSNGIKHVQKLQREAEEAAMQNQAAPEQQGPDPKTIAFLQETNAKTQAKIQALNEESQAKMARERAEFQQKLALNDAAAANKIARGY